MVRPGAVTPGLSEVLFRCISTVAGIRRIAPVDAAPHWQVLRAHCNTIVSVLETFVHDPVIDWTRRERSDEENPHARDALSTIEGKHTHPASEPLVVNWTITARSVMTYGHLPTKPVRFDADAAVGSAAAGRLKGVNIGVHAMPSLPLSVEGHAHRLIEEAVDKENLGSMYIWWMPWF